MATLHAGANNRIIRYLRDAREEAEYPIPPPDTAHTLVFDEDTNTATAADLSQSTDAYRLAGSALTKDGAPVVIAPDGESATVRKQAQQTVVDLTTLLGLPLPLNNAQRDTGLRTLARAVRYLIRREFGVA